MTGKQQTVFRVTLTHNSQDKVLVATEDYYPLHHFPIDSILSIIMFEKLNLLTRIIEKIKRFPVTFESMREWMKYENIEISDRTLYRYLKEAEELRMNDGRIITIEGDFNKKTWKFEYDSSDNELKENDIVSFLMLKGFFPNILAKYRKQYIDKIEEIIFKAQSKSKFEYHLQSTQKSISSHAFGEYNYTQQNIENVDHFVWAIQHYRKILLTTVTGETKPTNLPAIIIPMQIIYHNGSIFLMCLTENDNKLKAIDLMHIQQFEILNTPFDIKKYQQQYNLEISKRFGIEDNLNEQEYEIILHFSSELGKSVCNRFWHSSQKTNLLPDGKWEMQLQCGINNELIDWVIKWNKIVEVLKPEILLHKTAERISSGLIKQNRQNPQSPII